VEGERSRVFGSGDWIRRNKDGGRESEGYIGLAMTKVYQEYTEVLGIGELLLSIY